MQYLLETHKVSVDLRDTNNKTLVFHAVAGGRTPILRYLLSVVSSVIVIDVVRCEIQFYFSSRNNF